MLHMIFVQEACWKYLSIVSVKFEFFQTLFYVHILSCMPVPK